MQTAIYKKELSPKAEAALAILRAHQEYEPTPEDLAEAHQVHTEMEFKFFSDIHNVVHI